MGMCLNLTTKVSPSTTLGSPTITLPFSLAKALCVPKSTNPVANILAVLGSHSAMKLLQEAKPSYEH